MKALPTDIQILDAIYERYYDSFTGYSETNKNRSAKIYVPIEIKELAGDLKIDPDIVFGRLYYHLEEKYGYKHDDGSRVHFFALVAGEDRHCINFPYMASVLASLRDEDRKYRIATRIAVISLFLSVIALLVSIYG